MKKQYVKAETEIVPMKTESFMASTGQNTGTAGGFEPGEGDPDPGREEEDARAHNDDDDMEYFFELTPPQQKNNKE